MIFNISFPNYLENNMHRIKAFLVALPIMVISIFSFNCTVVAAGDRNFHNNGGYVSTVQGISSSANSMDVNSKFAGKDAGKKEKHPGNKHWRRKKGKCTDKKCRGYRKRKYTGNNYWGTQVGYRDEPVIVFVAEENEEEEGEKGAKREERMREEQRMIEEETRKDLERIKNEDWFR
ncbi:MAG: hypothetical protein OEM61_10915 [Desulfobacteraceae bacterium]|nr:hypothetical protein [Desulfobacteraceae bacterium]MDH3567846.1 hypothetical protein [Desulfobacteraceae bacterium]